MLLVLPNCKLKPFSDSACRHRLTQKQHVGVAIDVSFSAMFSWLAADYAAAHHAAGLEMHN